MKSENQPISTKNDTSFNHLQLKNKSLTKYIAPFIIPFYLGITTPVLNTSCGTKGKLQGLEQTINGQKEANKTQDTTIGGLKNNVQNIQTKLTKIEDANKTQLEKQNKTDTTQNEKIEAVSQTNEEKKEKIAQLEKAVEELKQLATLSSEIPNSNSQSSDSDQDQSPESSQTTQNLNLDLELQKAILSLLEEYSKTLILLPQFQTSMQVIDQAVKRDNIIKKVLTEGSALTHSHKTGKTIRVTIPKDQTFDFAEALRIINEIAPQQRKIQIDELIVEQRLKIQEMEEAQKAKDHLESTNQNGSRDDKSHTHVSMPRENNQNPSGRTSPMESTPSTPQNESIKKKEYTPLADLDGNKSDELIPLQVVQTGKGKYQIYEFDLNQLPSSGGKYTYIVYGVRGIISPEKSKNVRLENDLIVIEAKKQTGICEVRLTDGMIYIFDISNEGDREKVKIFIQSRLNEETDMHKWPQRKANQVKTIMLQ